MLSAESRVAPARGVSTATWLNGEVGQDELRKSRTCVDRTRSELGSVTINCRIRDELTKDRYPARKHLKWQSSEQAQWQAGEKDKKLLKKSEWQIEQPCPQSVQKFTPD